MKRYLLIASLAVLAGLTTVNTYAQNERVEKVENAISDNGKYALLASNLRLLSGGVITGETIKEKHPKAEFEIVLVGPILKDIASENEEVMEFVKRAINARIPLVACAVALKKQGISVEQLPEYIEVSSNAFLYLYGLEELGFKILTP